MAENSKIVLNEAVTSSNIFWAVAGDTTLESQAHLEGILLAQTAVTLGTEATINGRILSQTFVALQQATVAPPCTK